MTPPKKLYRSGEITHHTGISRQTLHYYTQIGLIQEVKRTKSGQRFYDESIFDVLERIEEYKRQKLTLMQIKKRIREDKQLKLPFYYQIRQEQED